MSPEDFSPLKVTRFELSLRAREACRLPAFLGSTLRGAFGHALKEAVCVMEHRNCKRCMVADRCIYPYIFETPAPQNVPQLRGQQQAPHPFILSPPSLRDGVATPAGAVGSDGSTAARRVFGHASSSDATSDGAAPPFFSDQRRQLACGDELGFGLTLMGRAIEYLPYIVYAVTEMSHRGLGVDRARFDLKDVHLIGDRDEKTPIYSAESQRVVTPPGGARSLGELIRQRLERSSASENDREDSDQLTDEARASANRLKLRFLTPARIRVDGDLQAAMSFSLLVRNLLRRVSLLMAVHGSAPLDVDFRGLIEQAESVKTIESNLSWCDWERYSNRQQTKMTLGGFMGEVEYQGDVIDQFRPFVSAGEVLHLGGSTAFGLGKYEIVQ